MNEKTIASVALCDRDYPNLGAKLAEANRWIELAAAEGADLVVLPEALNSFRFSVEAANVMPPSKIALDEADWQTPVRPLLDTARRCGVAVTVPLNTRRGNGLINSFFLVDRTGAIAGRYEKRRLTEFELNSGFVPGNALPLIQWEGLKLGGLICFDVNFPDTIADQVVRGAELVLMPSLTPGGGYLDFYSFYHAVTIVLAYPAWSRIIDAGGYELAAAGYRHETLRFGHGTPIAIAKVNFDRAVFHFDYNQTKIRPIQEMYGSKVRIKFRQETVQFVLESLSPDLTVQDIITKFELIPWREYFARQRKP